MDTPNREGVLNLDDQPLGDESGDQSTPVVDSGESDNVVASVGLRAASSIGIPEDLIAKWMGATPLRQEQDTGNRFDIEGPILPSGVGWGDGGFTTPKMLRKFLTEHKGEDIEIVINSPGGSVFDANAMVSDLTLHEGAIKIIVSGACFSAAADFLTVPNAERVIMKGSLIMIHNAWTIAAGDANELRAVVDRLVKMNDQCATRFELATKFSKDELLQMMDKETWFNEQEAVDGGLVDKIYEPAKTKPADDKKAVDESENRREEERADAAIQRANSAVTHRVSGFL